jgi:hypothetical protein
VFTLGEKIDGGLKSEAYFFNDFSLQIAPICSDKLIYRWTLLYAIDRNQNNIRLTYKTDQE